MSGRRFESLLFYCLQKTTFGFSSKSAQKTVFWLPKLKKKNYIKKKVFSKTNAQRRSLLSATARAASQLLKEYNLPACSLTCSVGLLFSLIADKRNDVGG